jgi:hypothetical protein
MGGGPDVALRPTAPAELARQPPNQGNGEQKRVPIGKTLDEKPRLLELCPEFSGAIPVTRLGDNVVRAVKELVRGEIHHEQSSRLENPVNFAQGRDIVRDSKMVQNIKRGDRMKHFIFERQGSNSTQHKTHPATGACKGNRLPRDINPHKAAVPALEHRLQKHS